MSHQPSSAKKATQAAKLTNPLWRADRLRFVVSDTSAEACKAFRSKEAIAAEKKEIAAARRKKAKDAIMAEYLRRTYDPAEWQELQARTNKPTIPREGEPLAELSSKETKGGKQTTGLDNTRQSTGLTAATLEDQDSGNEVDMPPNSQDVATRVYEVITID